MPGILSQEHDLSRAPTVVFMAGTCRMVVQYHLPYFYTNDTIQSPVWVFPPQVNEFSVPCNISEEARVTLEEKEAIIQKLKDSMDRAQKRMKHFADMNRTERTLLVGDMVYLKLQPYRQAAFGIRGSLKLRSKYYGPFKVLEKVGQVAYRLQLPDDALIHPVFHVSQLKKHLGKHAVPLPNLPSVGPNGQIKTEPVAVLQRRMIPKKGVAVTQWLILWQNLSPADATWEDTSVIQGMFQILILEDKD